MTASPADVRRDPAPRVVVVLMTIRSARPWALRQHWIRRVKSAVCAKQGVGVDAVKVTFLLPEGRQGAGEQRAAELAACVVDSQYNAQPDNMAPQPKIRGMLDDARHRDGCWWSSHGLEVALLAALTRCATCAACWATHGTPSKCRSSSHASPSLLVRPPFSGLGAAPTMQSTAWTCCSRSPLGHLADVPQEVVASTMNIWRPLPCPAA